MLAKREQGFPSLWRFDRMFEDLWSGFPFVTREGFAPSLDVFEDDEGLTVQAELPGLSQKDVTVEVDGSILTLRGEKTQESEEKDGRQYHRIERRYGSFLRQIQLPSSADTDKITATHRDGVLTIRVPKRPEARKKNVKIDVQ